MKKIPQELIDEIKKVYPDYSQLHREIENNSELVGRYLDDMSQGNISPQRIIIMIENNAVNQLKIDAHRTIEQKSIYTKWLKWYRANHELKHG